MEGKYQPSDAIKAQGGAEARRLDGQARNDAGVQMSDPFAQKYALECLRTEMVRGLQAKTLTILQPGCLTGQGNAGPGASGRWVWKSLASSVCRFTSLECELRTSELVKCPVYLPASQKISGCCYMPLLAILVQEL